MAKAKTWTVIYRTGGRDSAKWHRCLAVTDYKEAQRMAADIRRGGRKAIIHRTDQLNAIGMPEGWGED